MMNQQSIPPPSHGNQLDKSKYFERIVFYYPNVFTRVIVDTHAGLSDNEKSALSDMINTKMFCKSYDDLPQTDPDLIAQSFYIKGLPKQWVSSFFDSRPNYVVYAECPCASIDGDPLLLDTADKQKMWEIMKLNDPVEKFKRINKNVDYIKMLNDKSIKWIEIKELINVGENGLFKVVKNAYHAPRYEYAYPRITGFAFVRDASKVKSVQGMMYKTLYVDIACSPYKQAKLMMRSMEMLALLSECKLIALDSVFDSVPSYVDMGFTYTYRACTNPQAGPREHDGLYKMSKCLEKCNIRKHLQSTSVAFQNALMSTFPRDRQIAQDSRHFVPRPSAARMQEANLGRSAYVFQESRYVSEKGWFNRRRNAPSSAVVADSWDHLRPHSSNNYSAWATAAAAADPMAELLALGSKRNNWGKPHQTSEGHAAQSSAIRAPQPRPHSLSKTTQTLFRVGTWENNQPGSAHPDARILAEDLQTNASAKDNEAWIDRLLDINAHLAHASDETIYHDDYLSFLDEEDLDDGYNVDAKRRKIWS